MMEKNFLKLEFKQKKNINKCKIENIFFLFSYYLYYLSLEKCIQGFDECATNYHWIYMKIFEAIMSSFILALLIEFMFYNLISKLNIIHIAIFYITAFKNSHGLDFHDHGFYNFFGSISITILIIIFLFPLNIFIYLKKKNNFSLLHSLIKMKRYFQQSKTMTIK